MKSAVIYSLLLHCGVLAALLNLTWQQSVETPASANKVLGYLLPSLPVKAPPRQIQTPSGTETAEAEPLQQAKRAPMALTPEPVLSGQAEEMSESPPMPSSPKADASHAGLAKNPQASAYFSASLPVSTVPDFSRRIARQAREQAAEAHWRDRNKIDAAGPAPSSTEDTFEQPPTTLVDCDQAVAQGLAIASGLFGGTLRCQQRPDLDALLGSAEPAPQKKRLY